MDSYLQPERGAAKTARKAGCNPCFHGFISATAPAQKHCTKKLKSCNPCFHGFISATLEFMVQQKPDMTLQSLFSWIHICNRVGFFIFWCFSLVFCLFSGAFSVSRIFAPQYIKTYLEVNKGCVTFFCTGSCSGSLCIFFCKVWVWEFSHVLQFLPSL